MGQKLSLRNIIDGDTAAAALSDGGIKINQPSDSALVDLNLVGVGGNSANPNTNLFIDLAGSGLSPQTLPMKKIVI